MNKPRYYIELEIVDGVFRAIGYDAQMFDGHPGVLCVAIDDRDEEALAQLRQNPLLETAPVYLMLRAA